MLIPFDSFNLGPLNRQTDGQTAPEMKLQINITLYLNCGASDDVDDDEMTKVII